MKKSIVIDENTIKYLAKYIWFDREHHIKNEPYKVIAYAMRYADLGDYPVLGSLGKDVLRDVLRNAKPGWFDNRNWNFWHLVLGIKEDMKPLPKREFK